MFFALSMSVVIRLVAAADETSRLSELTGSALIAMENAAEEIKADPASGPFDANGAYSLTRETEDGILLSISVWKTAGAGGTLWAS